MRGVIVTAIAIVLPLASAGAAQVKVPACDGLTQWGASVNFNDNFNLAPRIALPKAFQDSALVPVFGVPVLGWAQDDIQAVSQALVACYGEAGKRRDQAAAGALANGNRAITGLLPRMNAAVQQARTESDNQKKQLDALPDSAELGRALDALVKGNPAAPDIAPFRPLPREVGEPSWRLAQVVLNLPDKDRETLYAALGKRRDAIQAGLATGAEKTIADAPDDAGGIIAVMEIRQRLGGAGDADTRARLAKAADDKAQKIRDTLHQAKPAVWIPPSCPDLYRWSSAQGATAGIVIAGRGLLTAFTDERAVPLFGLSVADWKDEDIARLKAVRSLCQAAAQQAAQTKDDPAAAELAQNANRGRWIDAADQQIADSRTMMIAYRKAKADLAAVIEKAKALPDTGASLLPLAQLASDPVQNQVSQDDRTAFANAINEKRAAIGVHATEAATKGLAEIKVATLGDFPKLLGYVGQTLPTIPDPRGQQAFREAATHSLDEAAARLLPELQAKLAALPATPEGMDQANNAVATLTGIPDASRLPAFKPYYDAVQARTGAIVKTVHDDACKDLLSSVSVGSDAKEPVWDGDKGMPLGDFICGLAEHGFVINSYAGAGMFSSTYTLKVTPAKEGSETISLHKAEVKGNTSMLVGFKIVDANGQQVAMLFATGDAKGNAALSVDGWQLYAEQAFKVNPMEYEGCKTVLAAPPPKPSPGDKLFLLHCAEQARAKAAAQR